MPRTESGTAGQSCYDPYEESFNPVPDEASRAPQERAGRDQGRRPPAHLSRNDSLARRGQMSLAPREKEYAIKRRDMDGDPLVDRLEARTPELRLTEHWPGRQTNATNSPLERVRQLGESKFAEASGKLDTARLLGKTGDASFPKTEVRRPRRKSVIGEELPDMNAEAEKSKRRAERQAFRRDMSRQRIFPMDD